MTGLETSFLTYFSPPFLSVYENMCNKPGSKQSQKRKTVNSNLN